MNDEDLYDEEELEEIGNTDIYNKMLREYVNNLPDEQKNMQLYAQIRNMKRNFGIDAKQFMWLNSKDKLEVLGIYTDNSNDFNYEE